MRKFVLITLAALSAVPVLAASAALPETTAVARTAAYIRTTQQPDGGFGGFGDGQSYDAIFALRAAGIDVRTVQVNGNSPVDFLEAKAADADTPAEAAKAALAARASGLEPKNVNGTNLVAVINDGYVPATGLYAADDFSQSLAMLGLACTGNNVPNSAILALRGTQLTAGGWGFGGTPDPDTTALAIQALEASGIPANDATIVKALAYLKSSQGSDGGWGFDPTASNANSTAFVVQALLALGISPESAEYTAGGVNPVAFIVSQQQADGSFPGFDPAYASNQALPALAGRTFCNAPVTPIQAAPPPSTATPATATPIATATRTTTAVATATRTSTPRATVAATRTPLAPRTGSGSNADGDDSGVPYMALALLALAAGGAGMAAASRRK